MRLPLTNPCWALSNNLSTTGVMRITMARATILLSVLLIQSGLVSLISVDSVFGKSSKLERLKLDNGFVSGWHK